MIEKILAENIKHPDLKVHYSVNIGDPAYCIDLVLETGEHSIGIIDISRFVEESRPAESMIAYYFQLSVPRPQSPRGLPLSEILLATAIASCGP